MVKIVDFYFRMVGKNPLAQFEEEKKEHEVRMQKMKSEMEQVFEMKVQEKKQKLKDSEMDVSVEGSWIQTRIQLRCYL